uniref:hypothetical protein n=2 Tax=Yoonia sp. TaxID=2212373 RepID=UPI00404778FF|tara:strand:- start:63421 stop:63939 length:519 start_codon:yes stop_codon:yes gene_type:complete
MCESGGMLARLLFFILLAACAPSERLQRSYSPETNVWQSMSRDAEVFRDGEDHISARTIILEGDGEVAYYLSMSFLRGGPNGPRILTVSQGAQRLEYVRHDRLNAFCIDRCHKAEVGQISLTQDQFRTAAVAGMILQVDGLRRNYTAVVPARLFSSALKAANLLAPRQNPPR